MKLSISIVNWNTKELLKNCLGSIFQNYSGEEFEVIVADNNSGDGSIEMLEEYFPRVNLIKNTENLGFGRANNKIMAVSKGEYILIINPDILIKKGAIEKMIDFLAKNVSAGAVGAKLQNPDGTIQMDGFYRRFPSLTQVLLYQTIFYRLFLRFPAISARYWEYQDVSEQHEVDQIPGACILVKREVYERTGGFDEDYFIWYEDVDWCYRIKKSGLKLYYLPEAEIVHVGGQSFLNMDPGEKIILFYSSLFKYFKKNHSKKDYYFTRAIIVTNFMIVNVIQIILYPFASSKRKTWRSNISARWRFIQNV